MITVRNCLRALPADTGRVREVATCISYRAKLTPEALRALASGALLSCPGKKVSKEAGSRGEQLAPARIVPPLRIPRVEPSGIDPSLWLGWYVLATAPVLGCGFWGASFPRCRLEDGKSPVSHNGTIPGAKRLPCQRELAPEATEGFTAGTFQKYKPMWKLASLRNPPASALPRHPPFARGALVYAPTAPQ